MFGSALRRTPPHDRPIAERYRRTADLRRVRRRPGLGVPRRLVGILDSYGGRRIRMGQTAFEPVAQALVLVCALYLTDAATD
jgi:hypothetical protein